MYSRYNGGLYVSREWRADWLRTEEQRCGTHRDCGWVDGTYVMCREMLEMNRWIMRFLNGLLCRLSAEGRLLLSGVRLR